MRSFGLITKSGTEINLTSSKIFFYAPEGLGYDVNLSYRRIGNEYVLESRELSQQTISGTIIFMGDDPYDQYYRFVHNTYKSGLILWYSPFGKKMQYWRDVVVSSITKTELNQSGFLECSIEFVASTPWYTRLYLQTRPANISNNYGWVWDTSTNPSNPELGFSKSSFPLQFRSSVDMRLVVNVETDMLSPCALCIRGSIIRPKWKHFVGQKLVAEGGVECNVSAHNFLIVDNRMHPNTMKIYGELKEGSSYTGLPDMDNVIRDAYADSDFETDRFIKLRRGRNTIEVYSADTPLTDNTAIIVAIDARIYHVSV